MQIVRVTLSNGDVTTKMQKMRSWLDSHRFEPSLFKYEISKTSDSASVQVMFKVGAEANAFAAEFGGTLSPIAG
jgi:hypothetical protein